MTIAWNKQDPFLELPAQGNEVTHALVVGIGDYDPSRSGEAGVVPAPSVFSAARSARAFVDWLIRSRDRLLRPLATVEVLISDPAGVTTYKPPGGIEGPVDSPTRRNVEDAADRWFQRCHRSDGASAVFFCCGHGLYQDQEYLLLEDYGTPAHEPFRNIVALRDFFTGMKTCRAGHQFFAADCCQEVIPETGEQLTGLHGTALVGSGSGSMHPSERGVIYSTTATLKSFTNERKWTYFTNALLTALKGEGARKLRNRQWWVTHQSLALAVPELVRRLHKVTVKPRVETECTKELPLGRLARTPQVDVALELDPRRAMPFAEIEVVDRRGKVHLQANHPNRTRLKKKLPAGPAYEASAVFQASSSYSDAQEEFDVEPLMDPIVMEVKMQGGRP